jgi:hypothetical protein
MLSVSHKLCTTEDSNKTKIASVRRLQKQRSQTCKNVLGSSPREDVFYTMENNDIRRIQIRPKLFVPAEISQK